MNQLKATPTAKESCSHCGEEKTAKDARALSNVMRRHRSVKHGIIDASASHDPMRRFHNDFKNRDRAGECKLDGIVRPRGARQNFDSSGALIALAGLLPSRRFAS